MDALLSALRAVAETTRLRLLWLLSRAELNVSELTQILGQSQPRVSRHLKVMCEAGLLERHKEGSWVLFRLSREAEWGSQIAAMIPEADSVLAGDRARLEAVRAARAERAGAYFRANARDWHRLRQLHVREEAVEASLKRLAGPGPFACVADLGTGTGRMLEIFAPGAQRALGVDLSHEMLAIARSRLEGLPQAEVRHADITHVPLGNGAADLVILHQVLHFLEDPLAALSEAARILAPGGHLLIADFAPHEREELRDKHAHRRLGFAPAQMADYLGRAGLAVLAHEDLPPPAEPAGGLTVSVWLAGRKA